MFHRHSRISKVSTNINIDLLGFPWITIIKCKEKFSQKIKDRVLPHVLFLVPSPSGMKLTFIIICSAKLFTFSYTYDNSAGNYKFYNKVILILVMWDK